MRRGRWWAGLCVGVAAASMLLPASTAGAAATSKSAACHAISTEEHSTDSVDLSLDHAVASRNFAASKQGLLRAYGTDESDVVKALVAARSAPRGVRSALQNLLSFVRQVRRAIGRSTGFRGLVTSFQHLAKDPRLVTDGVTIDEWVAAACGGSTTATSGVS
jgi:hypothetical protein